jgi:hypothetical protein
VFAEKYASTITHDGFAIEGLAHGGGVFGGGEGADDAAE